MKKILSAALVLALVFCAFNAYAGHGEAKEVKKGILLAAFGTSEESAKVSFTNIGEEVAKAFPGVDVRWAYTSHIIRRKLAKQGEVIPSPAEALAKMMDEGYTHVAVQSLHTIPGEEYHALVQTVNGFRAMPEGFERLTLGYPMLGAQDSVAKAVDAVIATIPKARKANEAVVLMGHGTHHPGNIYYSAMNWQLQQQDPNIIMGTVEGYPELNDVIDYLKANKIRKVWIMPFMSVAGDHAKNDMAGPEDDSWKTQLTKAGFKCETVLKGAAEYDEFVDIWVGQLTKAFAHL
ncbi:sirohydrochlorin cobaltochelatase [Desulfatibacillum alkenivorans DSM 16219]|jgi:sirohydrochlorin cobaltochelatase|uniref:Sirohydrochlorin cobaltochelatase n=1 Tax=Desulfatibacillum alkenivorans DSM 16219 TaxID=1121393 RepID=A0A1M6UBQ1_9BACT|nr:sirohydrochlorin cobaltochelatase [Desulfatibacillum alkenivorans]SHK66597.1 sirohydrochlorin cobaltochelatase [Desulfatibacillum alkenivorans DSM 16219]